MYFDAKHCRSAGRIRAQPGEPAIAVAMLDGEMSVCSVCIVLTRPCSHAYVPAPNTWNRVVQHVGLVLADCKEDWAEGCTDAPARVDCRLKRLLEKAAELRLETSIMFVYDEGRRDTILLVLSEA